MIITCVACSIYDEDQTWDNKIEAKTNILPNK